MEDLLAQVKLNLGKGKIDCSSALAPIADATMRAAFCFSDLASHSVPLQNCQQYVYYVDNILFKCYVDLVRGRDFIDQ